MEKDIPNVLKGNISLKWITMHALSIMASALEENQNKDVRVFLLTPAGVITGKIREICLDEKNFLEPLEPNSEEKYRMNLSYVAKLREDVIRNIEENEPDLTITESGSFINLEDVTINLPSSNIKIPQLMVFVSQIIGFSLETSRSSE